MGMYQNIQDILQVLWYDEELLRLLHYEPENIKTNSLDPLSPSLKNILDMPEIEQWNIRENAIMLTPKEDNIIGDRKCIIFVYLGDRSPHKGSFVIAAQNVVFDVFCHSDFENGDMRTTRIGDRLNKLFTLENITGISKMDFIRGRVISRVPSQYVGYQFIYNFINLNKDSEV